MAAVRITNATFPAYHGQRCGPFKDNSGNLWAILFNASGALTGYESTDGGASWTAMASASSSGSGICDCWQDATNDVIYVLTITGGSLNIWTFDMGSNAWGTFATSGPSPAADVNSRALHS